MMSGFPLFWGAAESALHDGCSVQMVDGVWGPGQQLRGRIEAVNGVSRRVIGGVLVSKYMQKGEDT